MTSVAVRRQARIVGHGQSAFFKRGASPLSAHRMVLQAIIGACDDAGIDVASIDGLVAFGGELITASAVVDGLGLEDFRYGAQPNDGSGGGLTQAVGLAVSAVEAGVADTVAVYKAIRQDFMRYGRPGGYQGVASQAGRTVHHEPSYANALVGAFAAPFGVSVPVQHWALHARRHMYEYGTTTEQFGAVAVTIRRHASRNPHALLRGAISIEDHACSRTISSPLRLLDCCLESDGAAALVVTTRERSADCRSRPVEVLGGGYATEVGMSTLHGWPGYPGANIRKAGDRAFSMAGLCPQDIATAQIYDHFTSHVIMALEDLGFCDPGLGGPFVESGAAGWPDGSIPINTSGGSLSEVYLAGMNLVVEAVRQLRGESTCQVRNARTALVSAGGASAPTGVVILGA